MHTILPLSTASYGMMELQKLLNYKWHNNMETCYQLKTSHAQNGDVNNAVDLYYFGWQIKTKMKLII